MINDLLWHPGPCSSSWRIWGHPQVGRKAFWMWAGLEAVNCLIRKMLDFEGCCPEPSKEGLDTGIGVVYAGVSGKEQWT